MTPTKPRTQFRVGKNLYTPVEGIRKEYERYRFIVHQDAKRVTTELIILTLAEYAGLLPKPTDPDHLDRHIAVMRLIAAQRDNHGTRAAATNAHMPPANIDP